MKVIGLCGGSGSGKGAVGDVFQRFGALVIDTDALYHKMTSGQSECLDALVREFGDDIVHNGALDRKKLSSIVFYGDGAKARLEKLNGISHKFILDEVRRIIADGASRGFRYAVVDAPLLFESGFDSECDVTVAVVANTETRIARIMARDGISREKAELRIASQHTDEWLIENSDFVVRNDNGISLLEEQVKIIFDQIR